MLIVGRIGNLVDFLTMKTDISMTVGTVVAREALERFLARVDPHVFGQLRIDEKLLATVRAHVVPLFLVDSHHVVLETMSSSKDLSAEITHVIGVDLFRITMNLYNKTGEKKNNFY